MIETLPIVFVLTSIILIITSGQDMILAMSGSVSQRRKTGITTAAVVSVELLGHKISATPGLCALVNGVREIMYITKTVDLNQAKK